MKKLQVHNCIYHNNVEKYTLFWKYFRCDISESKGIEIPRKVPIGENVIGNHNKHQKRFKENHFEDIEGMPAQGFLEMKGHIFARL